MAEGYASANEITNDIKRFIIGGISIEILEPMRAADVIVKVTRKRIGNGFGFFLCILFHLAIIRQWGGLLKRFSHLQG